MKTGNEVVINASPGLQTLYQKIQDEIAINILELGPARGSNIEFWSRFYSSIFVADLRDSLPLPPQEEDQEFLAPEWSSILNLPSKRYFDVVLIWDLLNYIDFPAIPSLIDYLKHYCKPGTILFTLVIDQAQIPEVSTIYSIVDEEHLGYEISGSELGSRPRLQPRALENMMQGFRISDSYRLRHGIIEYLFTFY